MGRRKNPADKPTINEIAQSCGVSVSTVSRALCNRPRVAAELREKILSEAQKRNYNFGSYKRQGKVLIIGGAKDYFVNGVYYHDMLNSLSARFSQAGSTVIVAPESGLSHLGELYFDGGICLSEQEHILHEWEDRYNLPLILPNMVPAFASDNFYTIQTDEQEIMNRVFDMLIEHHHQHIGLLLTGGENSSNRDRYANFWEAARSRNLEHSCFAEESDDLTYFNALGVLIRRGITALICPSETHWCKITHALWLYKIEIPEKLSLVIWEGDSPMEYHTPPLTAVRQNFADFAACSFDIIQKRMQGIYPAQHYSVHSTLIERESVRTL